MPAVADPGSDIVRKAHLANYLVKPLIGPSSIILALSASGMNGNAFSFNGYLPIKDQELRENLKALENRIVKTGQTQIFIETPYRNNRIVNNILSSIKNQQLLLCIALDLNGKHEYVKTKSIKEWKTKSIDLPKLPAIFLLGR